MRALRTPPVDVPPELALWRLHREHVSHDDMPGRRPGGMGWRLPLCAHDGGYLLEALHNHNSIAYIYAKVIGGLR